MARPRIEPLGEGRVRVRDGTQTACGGFAEVTGRVARVDEGLSVVFAAGEAPPSQVDGASIPPELRAALVAGAATTFEEADVPQGVRVEVLHAFVHPVDGNPRVFGRCGARLVRYAVRATMSCLELDEENGASS